MRRKFTFEIFIDGALVRGQSLEYVHGESTAPVGSRGLGGKEHTGVRASGLYTDGV